MAKSAYKWTKVSENGKWANYCTTHDLPVIISLKNDKYKVEAGKDSRIEDSWEAAVKYAIEIGKKRAKAVRKFNKQEGK